MLEQLFGNSFHRKHGVATLELVIAFAILTMSLSGIILLTFSNQSLEVSNELASEATYKAQKILEDARAVSRFDFNLLNTEPQTNEVSGPITFTRKLDISQINFFTKQATSTITWRENGRNISIAFSTLLTNPQAAKNGSDTCSSILSGNWKSPVSYAWNMGQLGINGNNGNGFSISDVRVFNKKLYVVTSASPNTYKDTFFIFGLPENPSSPPIFQGSVDNSSSQSAGLRTVAVSGNYAYVANANGSNFTTCNQSDKCAQLQVIDLSDQSAPVVKASIKVPGVTGTAGQAIGSSISYANGYIYLGLAKTASGPEFNVFDVSNPLMPVWKGGYNIGNAVNAISIKQSIAYIVTPNTENLTLININTPTNLTKISGYTPPLGSNNGKSVAVVGNTTYLGRTFGANEFSILNTTNNGTISLLGTKDIGSGNQTTINGLIVRNNLAFILTPAQFQVWDITNQALIIPWTSDGTANTFFNLTSLGGTGASMSCEGNVFYTALSSSQGNSKDIIAVITAGP